MLLLVVILSGLWPEGWYQNYRMADQARALEHLLDLSESTPGRGPALAMSMHFTGEPGALEGMDADSSDFRYWTALGAILTVQEPDRAFQAFQAALDLVPGADPVLLEAYAYLNLLEANPDEAHRLASLALEADPGFSPASLTAAWALEDMGRHGEAIQVLEQGLRINPRAVSLLEEKAMILESAGMPDSALSVMTAVLEIDPRRVHALRTIAVLLEEQGRLGDAVKAYRSLLENNPGDYRALGQLGFAMEQLGRTEQAEEYYLSALEINPLYAWPYQRLAYLTDDPYMKVTLLGQAVQADSTFGGAWLDLGLAYEDTGDLESAAFALRRSLDYSPSSWTWGELGWVQESLGRLDEAAVSYESGVALDSSYTYGWQRRGSLYREKGDNRAALDWYALALSHIGEDPWILGEMGGISMDQGDPELAAEFFSRAVDAEPDYGYGLLSLARIHRLGGDYESALDLLDGYLLLPSAEKEVGMVEKVFILEEMGLTGEADSLASLLVDGLAYTLNGWNALAFGYPGFAETAAERAFARGSDSPWQWIELGELFEALEKTERALESFERAALYAGDDVSVHREIAGFFYREGDYARAGNRLSAALELDSTATVLSELGEARLFEGRLREAEEALLAALDRDPSSVFAICYLGLIEERRGNPDKAVRRYLDALRLMPGYSYAESRIQYISGGDYDRRWHSERYSPLSWGLWADLSVSSGNQDESVISGGGSLGLNYTRGSSVKLKGSMRLEDKNNRRERETGYASLTLEHFFSDRLYAGLSSSWDRQPLTVRPWQVSSYLAAGWKSWPADWVWLAPEIGVGLVNTRWSLGDRERTDRVTSYGSFGVWMRRPRGWLPHLWLAGSLYLPPEDIRHTVGYGTAELDFDLPGPLSVLLGLSFDYTRTPAVETWEKFDLDYYLRLRLGN